jgi:type II secretory pathway component PulK
MTTRGVQVWRRRGSVLIMALWALLLISGAVFAWLKFINKNIEVTADHNNGLKAKAYAHSGVMVALNPDVTQLTPLLVQQFAADRGYVVQMTGEGGKLNLNWIFANPQQPDPGRLALFDRYLERRGLNFQQRARLSDCILDWLTPGNVPRLNGAKESADYHPPGRGAFLSVDELAQVKGSTPLVSQAGWKDDFTIYTNPGLIDVQWASRLILECLPGVGDENAARFIQYRQGPDHLDGTIDDHIFQKAADAYSMLGVSGAQLEDLQNYATIEYPMSTVHIRSTGQCGNVYRHVEVVAKKQGMQPIILSWKEM